MGHVTLDGLTILLGAFYAAAGVVGVRAAALSRVLDASIAAISAEPPDPVRLRLIWLTSLSTVVFAGGVAAAARADPAPYLFAVACVMQALHLTLLAPCYFDPAGGTPVGRRRTSNAFVIYLAATMIVLTAATLDRLRPVAELSTAEQALAFGAAAVFSGYLWRLFR